MTHAINRLRKERKDRIDGLKALHDSYTNSRDYSEEFKQQKTEEFEEAVNSVSDEFDHIIHDRISERETEATQKFHNAEYSGLNEETTSVELLKEMRNNNLTDQLVAQHQGSNLAKDKLRDEVKGLVEANSPKAPAYFNAMNKLGVASMDVMSMQSQYEEQNLNEAQKAAKGEIDNINSIKEEFHVEVNGDPFENILSKYE